MEDEKKRIISDVESNHKRASECKNRAELLRNKTVRWMLCLRDMLDYDAYEFMNQANNSFKIYQKLLENN